MRYRGRGRPPAGRDKKDLGTKELQAKRARHETEELLDQYRRLGIISEQQHWCGNHFRWLYTLRYGVPNVRAVDPGKIGSKHTEIAEEDPYRIQLAEDYKEALEQLSAARLLSVMMDVAIYSQCKNTRITEPYHNKELTKSLDILVDLWC